MFHFPAHLLESLKCSTCGGFLSSAPIAVSRTNQHICGKCFKILPKDEQRLAARQLVYETIAENLTFPCRYKINGCSYTYKFNEETKHELDCHYRFPQYYKFPLEANGNTRTSTIQSSTNDIKAELTYSIKQNSTYSTLNYNLYVIPNTGRIISIKNSSNHEETNNINLTFEGNIILTETPTLIHNDIRINKVIEENHYEIIQSDIYKQCIYCKRYTENMYECKQGHASCNNCKKSTCIMCLDKNQNTLINNYYRNYSREKSLQEKNSILHKESCPILKCATIDTWQNLQNHLKDSHKNDVIISNEFQSIMTNADENIVFLCFGHIFKCVYYAYESYFEIFVEFLGPVQMAQKFWYELIFVYDEKEIKKRGKCCTKHDAMLSRGISFEKSDLGMSFEDDFSINFNIVLMQS